MTYILVVRLDISRPITSAHYLHQSVSILHCIVLFVVAFSAFHSIRFPIFHPLHTGAAFSSPAVSTLVIWCHVFQSRVFHPCIFDGATLSVLAFSVAPSCCLTRDMLFFRLIIFVCVVFQAAQHGLASFTAVEKWSVHMQAHNDS